MEIFAPLVGVTFRGGTAREIVKHLRREDGELLSLKAEPTNEYDDHAVQVIYDPTGEHIGYIAKENNFEIFEGLMAGAEFIIQIVGFENTLKPTLLIEQVDDDALNAEDFGEYPGDR